MMTVTFTNEDYTKVLCVDDNNERFATITLAFDCAYIEFRNIQLTYCVEAIPNRFDVAKQIVEAHYCDDMHKIVRFAEHLIYTDVNVEFVQSEFNMWAEDECRDWDLINTWRNCDCMLTRSQNRILQAEEIDSCSTMLEWNKCEDEEGFGYMFSDSNWHSRCGAITMGKDLDGEYMVRYGSNGDRWYVDNRTSAEWFAEAIVRHGYDHIVDDDENFFDLRVGMANSGNWYALTLMKTSGVFDITVMAYNCYTDEFGATIWSKSFADYDEALDAFDAKNAEVEQW